MEMVKITESRATANTAGSQSRALGLDVKVAATWSKECNPDADTAATRLSGYVSQEVE